MGKGGHHRADCPLGDQCSDDPHEDAATTTAVDPEVVAAAEVVLAVEVKKRPGRARVFSEADLDVELGLGSGGGGKPAPDTRAAGAGALPKATDDNAGAGGGRCHGFSERNLHGEWFNAGFADNIFGSTALGRRIIPASRARALKWRLIAAAAVSGTYAAAELTAAELSGSTALLADAMHMFSDFASYAISLAILWFTASTVVASAKTSSNANANAAPTTDPNTGSHDGNDTDGHEHGGGGGGGGGGPGIVQSSIGDGGCGDNRCNSGGGGGGSASPTPPRSSSTLTYGYGRLEVLGGAVQVDPWVTKLTPLLLCTFATQIS